MTIWYSRDVDQVFEELNSRTEGTDEADVSGRLKKWGINQLKLQKRALQDSVSATT